MAVPMWRPDLAIQVAFNADPNDPTTTPQWTDLSSVFRSAQQVTRGRQYELDQNQAAQPTLSFLDQNEWLNPANTASPYAPNVVPYRQILWQAMWPNGGTGNLLNAGYGTNPNLHTTAGYDPTFESYTTGSVPPWVLTFAASPTVSTSNPFQGTKSLQFSMTGGGGEQAVGLTIPCIPGRQYTASMYVRQTAANTLEVLINNGPAGTTTTTVGSYVRMTVTFTATQPTHQLFVLSFAPTLNSTVNIDAIQHEPGPTASTFTTSGPVIYGVFRGYVERWPSRWDYMGYLGEADLTAVDAYAALNLVNLNTEYRNAVLALEPDYYWPLSEPQDATSFAEISGNNGPPLVMTNSKYGAATTFQAGQQQDIPGDPGATGVETNTTSAGFLNLPTTILQTGIPGTGTQQISIGSTTPPYAYTVSAWIAHNPSLVTDAGRIFVLLSDPAAYTASVLNAWPTKWSVIDATHLGIGSIYSGSSIVDNWANGSPHLFVMTTSITSTTSTTVTYVDGVQVATNTGTTIIPGFPTLNVVCGVVEIGGGINPQYGQSTPGLQTGIYSHLALWNRALSSGEVTALWNGGKGYPGETSGQRVARYLSDGNWFGLTSIDTGQSVMGVSDLQANTAVLAACQDVTTTENGDFYVDSWGNLTFASRTRRYLETTSLYTFGERTDLGEYPYEGDIDFDFDPTLVYNDVEVDNYQGVQVVAPDPDSQLAYFRRSYQRSVNVLDNFEAIDAANYLLGQHKDPHLRVNTITLDPAGNPNLWPVVLSLEIGQRVTVKRRANAANGGAGLTISADFYVEQISHTNINMGTDQTAPSWQTTLYLSPVDIYQVGILDNSTFGRIGSAGARLLSSITAAVTSATVVNTGEDWYSTTDTFAATIDNEIVQVTAVAPTASDTFGRTASSSWGNATSGQPWTISGGSAADYSVTGGTGRQANAAVNTLHTCVLDIGSTDFDFYADFQLSIGSPSGAPATSWLAGRLADLSNYYTAQASVATNGSVTLALAKRVAGTLSGIGSSAIVGPLNTSSTWWRCRFRGVGTTLQAKLWVPASQNEPLWQVATTDTSLTAGTQIGLMSRLEAGNTNSLPVTWQWDNLTTLSPQTLTFTRPTDGTAAAHAANAPVQVSQPFILAY